MISIVLNFCGYVANLSSCGDDMFADPRSQWTSGKIHVMIGVS